MPNVPSLTEIIPEFRKPSTWFGFFGPAKLPPEILARLNTEMRKAIIAPDVAQPSSKASDMIDHRRHAGAVRRACRKHGIEQFGEIIKAAGIEPQ